MAASGRKRRFPIHPSSLRGLSSRVRDAYLRPMGNEARNFYPQEGVAAVASTSCIDLLDFCRECEMKSRPMVCLYDSVVSNGPLEERFICSELHQMFMTDLNVWNYHDRWMNYPIDTEFNYRWSWKPSGAQRKQLADRNFHPMDPVREAELHRAMTKIRTERILSNPEAYVRLNVA